MSGGERKKKTQRCRDRDKEKRFKAVRKDPVRGSTSADSLGFGLLNKKAGSMWGPEGARGSVGGRDSERRIPGDLGGEPD